MRHAFTILLLALHTVAAAQPEVRADLIASAKALPLARTDAARDTARVFLNGTPQACHTCGLSRRPAFAEGGRALRFYCASCAPSAERRSRPGSWTATASRTKSVQALIAEANQFLAVAERRPVSAPPRARSSTASSMQILCGLARPCATLTLSRRN